jgi:hypothetical protein
MAEQEAQLFQIRRLGDSEGARPSPKSPWSASTASRCVTRSS